MKYFLLAFCMSLLAVVGNTHAQKIDTTNSLQVVQQQLAIPGQAPSVIPPSPDAASLGRYGEIPVELSKGIPSIDIPIYEVVSGSLKLPVSLSYHASGVRVNDMSTSVGLSWTLNAGGAITRSINGFPDENSGGYRTAFPALQNSGNPFLCYIGRLAGGEIDGQSDNYFYNFSGKSGKFLYANKRKTASDQNLPAIVPVTLPFKPLKIEQSANVYTITDVDGVIYTFGKTVSDTLSTETTYTNSYQYTSTWYLTHIVSANRLDTIRISYTTPVLAGIPPTYSKTLLKTVSSTQQVSYSYQQSQVTNLVGAIYPSTIHFKNGKISFVYAADRQDLSGGKRLSAVYIYAKNASSQYSQIKRFELSQSYFSCADGYTQSELNGPATHTNSSLRKRMRLNLVTEKSSSGASLPPYQFIYYEDVPLPIYGAYAQDFWGFSNGANNSKLLILDTDINANPKPEPSATYGANRQANFTYAIAGSLKSVTYPTGGQTVFEYEEPVLSNGTKGGGVRIKSIANYENTTLLDKKIFSYLQGYLTNTIINSDLSLLAYPYSMKVEDATDCSNPTTVSTVTTFSENYNCMLGTNSGSAIEYASVEESSIDALGNKLGKKVSTFRQVSDYTSTLFPYSRISYDWLRGQLLEEKYYNTANNLLKRTVNQYSVVYTDSVARGYGALTSYQPRPCGIKTSYCTDGNPLATTDFQWKSDVLDNLIGMVLLDSTMTYTYDELGTNLIFEKAEFTYAKATHHQVTRKRTINSKNQTEETNYKYPHELASTSVDYQEMVNRHIYSPIVEEEQKVNNVFAKLIKTNYKRWYPSNTFGGVQGFFAPLSVQQQLAGGSLINQIVFGEKLVSPNEDGYDNKAHPVVYTELNGTVTRFTWWAQTGKLDQVNVRQTNGLFSTTYDYYPLIGLKSITNPDGKVIFYEYDVFNRLSKMHNDTDTGPVLKSFCYNYAGQSVACEAITGISGVANPPTLTLLPDVTNPLPVTLIEFVAIKQEQTSLLSWKTTEETNSSHFVIERSVEGKHWSKIGSVDAKGESTTLIYYSFRDNQPQGGQNLYRLKMIDHDGSFSYSRVEALIFENGIALYPNPIGSGDKLQLKGIPPEKVLMLTIYDQQGKVLYSEKPKTEKIETAQLPAGSYLIQVNQIDGSTTMLRFVKK